MTPEAVRRIALALPGAREAPHFERTSFRVGKRIFATLTRDGREAMVMVPSPDDLEGLLSSHPGTFFSYGGWTAKYGALGVRLSKVGAGMMRQLVTGAWKSVASKRAVADFEG